MLDWRLRLRRRPSSSSTPWLAEPDLRTLPPYGPDTIVRNLSRKGLDPSARPALTVWAERKREGLLPSTGKRQYRGRSLEERVSERRGRIMDAALELFATKGWENCGVKEICAAAGVTDRYLYESWRNTSELFLDVHQAVADKVFKAVVAAAESVDPEHDPQAFLKALIGTFLHELEADPRIAHMLFVDPGPRDVATRRGDKVRSNMLRYATLMEVAAADYFGPEAAGSGALRFWSLSTVGAFRTTMVEWLAGGLEMSSAELVDALVMLVFDGGVRVAKAIESD